jgi:hypothetical protein
MLSLLLLTCLLVLVVSATADQGPPPCFSGVYPHLAVSNHSMECGIGAVVPWAGRLWFLTYSPHEPDGSEDKLYELSPDLVLTPRPESIGGTPANRMIHPETRQLIIGPYVIDRQGGVRAIPYEQMPGRPTATMRHLTDPTNKVYIYMMEGELYELDLQMFHVKHLFDKHTLPGSHGKGAYTAQGRVVFANNGEWGWHEQWAKDHAYDGPTGALVEWDGADWRVVEREQFCEVTGPGGIFGAPSDDSPLWATGWDRRSVILKLLDGGRWHTFRLPKASHTHDGGHGWHTEWPRVRAIADDRLLMAMHGMLFDFPPGFSADDTSGLRPLSTHHKMLVDVCAWQGRLVFACNDASRFDNPFVNQPQSNLWFTEPDRLRDLGPPMGWGGPWVNDFVAPGEVSDPFHFAGYGKRVLHLSHTSAHPVTFSLELDREGTGEWSPYGGITAPARGYEYRLFPRSLRAEWVRLRCVEGADGVCAYFHYLPGRWPNDTSGLFERLAGAREARITGIIHPRGEDLGTLQALLQRVDASGVVEPLGYHEIGADMRLQKVDDPPAAAYLAEKAALGAPDFEVDEASVILTDPEGQRWRLPKGDPVFDGALPEGRPRGFREVVTERSLLNCHGSLYEIPRESSGGLRAMRPVCTHNRLIADFCSWRGMLVMAGTTDAGLWFGNVDDLWKLGKPRGQGGPWHETSVQPGVPSDPYLMTGYDRKRLELRHDSRDEVTVTVEVDFVGDSAWHAYASLVVPPGETLMHEFPDGYGAHWVRLTANRSCAATARLVYD